MKHTYRVIYKKKIPINLPGQVADYRFETCYKKIKADSFTSARDKIRRGSGYEITSISVTEVKRSWLMKLLRK